MDLPAHKAVVRFQAAPGDVAQAAARLAEEVESVGFEATVPLPAGCRFRRGSPCVVQVQAS